MNKQTKVITSKNVRFSYANLLTPKSPVEGAEPVYSVSLIISKDDKFTIDRINNTIQEIYEERLSKVKRNSKSVPVLENIKSSLKDGNFERIKDLAYEDCYFINECSITLMIILNVKICIDYINFMIIKCFCNK